MSHSSRLLADQSSRVFVFILSRFFVDVFLAHSGHCRHSENRWRNSLAHAWQQSCQLQPVGRSFFAWSSGWDLGWCCVGALAGQDTTPPVPASLSSSSTSSSTAFDGLTDWFAIWRRSCFANCHGRCEEDRPEQWHTKPNLGPCLGHKFRSKL